MRSLGPDSDSVRDYTGFAEAVAALEAGEVSHAEAGFGGVLAHEPKSPLIPQAARALAGILTTSGRAGEVESLVQAHRAVLGEPVALSLLAGAAAALGDDARAAPLWQAVYHRWPDSPEGGEAGTQLETLRSRMGSSYPEPAPALVHERIGRLLRRSMTAAARRELTAAADAFRGADAELLRVRLCAVDYVEGRNAAAYRCLLTLRAVHGEAGAERLFYLLSAARRLARDAEVVRFANALGRHRQASWRLEGLVSAGNHFLLKNRVSVSDRFFRACATDFPKSDEAAYCHWKLAWSAHMRRAPQRQRLLLEHVRRFPDSGKAPAALYYLGRRDELRQRYPWSWYASLAGGADAQPARTDLLDWTPLPIAEARIARARILSAAGYPDWADQELRFAVQFGDAPQRHVLAAEAAALAANRGEPHRGLRLVKALFPAYIRMQVGSAPAEFWRLAYPLPYREQLEAESRRHRLDPFLVAALIRQESEFDPRAISPARAYGLMQLLESTASEVSRAAGIEAFSREQLFEPQINLRLGTHNLRSLLDRFNGKVEAALAAYNAGPRRAREWLTWYTYREPAEFMETIPFSETRDYVQIILRNAEIYRRIYGSEGTR